MSENASKEIKIMTPGKCEVYFAPDVLSTIAGLAISEVEGIANSVRFSGLITEKLTRKPTCNIKNLTKGIKIEVEEGVVSVQISCMVEYGYSVHEVCANIQENVKKTIETMTGMTVKTVDVHVTGLSFAKDNKEAAELEYQKYMLESSEDASSEEEALPENNDQQAE